MSDQLPQFPQERVPKESVTESVIFKLSLICVLTLVLLIPAYWIQSMIKERQELQEEVNLEITEKWTGPQKIGGPVLVLPYKSVKMFKDSAGKSSYKSIDEYVFLLPEKLDINTITTPEIRHRGIFDAVVYNAKVNIRGSFGALELKKSGLDPASIDWKNAKIFIGVADLKGLKNNPLITAGQQKIEVEPDFSGLSLFDNNLLAVIDLSTGNTVMDFNLDIDLRGSGDISFLHLGKSTGINIKGSWGDPKFIGSFLPEKSTIDPASFSADWKIPYFNRKFPQQWKAENASLQMQNENSGIGVKFLLPVDQYQKTMRTAKYAVLIILLTFISLFFTELLLKKRIHLLQYILIGASMTIYYTLLLSFSEQLGYNWAYLIASVATILLIGIFIFALLKDKKPAILITLILSIFYSFIYVIIQLQDMALLVGSVGLFVIIATLMQISQRINWYKN